MKIYYLQKDQQFRGPFTLDEIRAQALIENDMVWKDGTADWVAAINLQELACMFRQPSSAPTQIYSTSGDYFWMKLFYKWIGFIPA